MPAKRTAPAGNLPAGRHCPYWHHIDADNIANIRARAGAKHGQPVMRLNLPLIVKAEPVNHRLMRF